MTRPTPETLAHRANPATVAAAASPAPAVASPVADLGRRRARSVARGARRRGRVRHPGRGDPAGVRPALRLQGAAHPGPPRAGRRARRDRLRAGHRQGRRLHRDQRPGRDQPGHPDRRRLHGLGADRRDHRPGGPPVDRHGRLPGGGHPGHHAADHQAQLPGPDARGAARGSSPRRSTWPPPAGPARCWSTSPRTCCRRRPRSPGRRPWTCPATGRPCTRTASRSARRPG